MNNIAIIPVIFYLLVINNVTAQVHDLIINKDGMTFSTKVVYIGDTIKFSNKDQIPHRIQVESKSNLFIDTGILNPGLIFNYEIKKETPSISIGYLSLPVLIFKDIDNPTKELKISFSNEPIVIQPKKSWFIKSEPFTILVFIGVETLGALPMPLPARIETIQFILDNKIIFNGSFDDFLGLDYISSTGYDLFQKDITLLPISGIGYKPIIINIPNNTLSFGRHSVIIKVVLQTGNSYEDKAEYIIL